MSEILGITFPYKPGAQKPPFSWLRKSTASLTAYIFGMTDIDNRSSALTTKRGLLHRLKTTCTLVHKRCQIGSEFSPALRKICIPLHCQASQTEISKRNSTTLWQVINCTRGRIVPFMRYSRRSKVALFATPLAFDAPSFLHGTRS